MYFNEFISFLIWLWPLFAVIFGSIGSIWILIQIHSWRKSRQKFNNSDIINMRNFVNKIKKDFSNIEGKYSLYFSGPLGRPKRLKPINETLLKNVDEYSNHFLGTELKGLLINLVNVCEDINSHVRDYNIKPLNTPLLEIRILENEFFSTVNSIEEELNNLNT